MCAFTHTATLTPYCSIMKVGWTLAMWTTRYVYLQAVLTCNLVQNNWLSKLSCPFSHSPVYQQNKKNENETIFDYYRYYMVLGDY